MRRVAPAADAGPLGLYVFTQRGCDHCAAFVPVLRLVAGNAGVPYQLLDAAAHPGLVRTYRVRLTPTVLLTRGGKVVVRRWDGAPALAELAEALRAAADRP